MFSPLFEFFRRVYFLAGVLLRRFLLLIRRPFARHGALVPVQGVRSQGGRGRLRSRARLPLWILHLADALDPRFQSGLRDRLQIRQRGVSAGEQVAAEGSGATTKTCGRSAIVDVTADLINLNVNKNEWIPSMILYKLGFFGLSWDATPFLDNKASFQRGVQQAIQRTAVELTDQLGRVRGTSAVDPDLQ